MVFYNFFFFLPQCAACRILVPQPGIEPGLLVVRVHSLNHWTAREFLKSCVLKIKKNVLFPVLFLVIREYTPSDLNFFFWFSQFVFCFKLKYSWFARCVSFKCIAQRFSYTHVYIFSSDSLTLEVITKYWV